MKETIKRLLEYLGDEDQHFWENCQCSEEIQETQNFHRCTCEGNKNHIFRDVENVAEWLSSPWCPLVDEDELEDGEISDEQESRNRREWAERYDDE